MEKSSIKDMLRFPYREIEDSTKSMEFVCLSTRCPYKYYPA